MGTTAKLAVLMSTFNRPTWAREAIKSILASDTDLRLFIVDNGSDKETSIMLGEIKDPRIVRRRIEQNNIHAAAEILFSFGHNHKYNIVFPDDDVITDSTWLKEAVNMMEEDDSIGLVWSWMRDMDHYGNLKQQIRGDKLTVATFDDLFTANYIPMSACVFRSALVKVSKLEFFGEWEMWLSILSTHKGCSIPRVTTYLRHHAGSESQRGARCFGFMEAHFTIWSEWLERGYMPTPTTIKKMAETWASLVSLAGLKHDQWEDKFISLITKMAVNSKDNK